MRSAGGTPEFPNVGYFLEVIRNQKLVWTAALKPGYRPQSPAGIPLFTAVILLEPNGVGTKYTAIAIRGDEEAIERAPGIGLAPHRLGQSTRPTRNPREDNVDRRPPL